MEKLGPEDLSALEPVAAEPVKLPMEAELWAAGADLETSRFVARMLDQNGYKIIKKGDDMDALTLQEMARRFLRWKLPEDFRPDGGVSFDQSYLSAHGPTGTNLLTFVQSLAMVRHLVDGAEVRPSHSPIPVVDEEMILRFIKAQDDFHRGKEMSYRTDGVRTGLEAALSKESKNG